uniref:Mediator of RNA polymerase II transcription subunit 8 n=1 Tax=Peronospora matthiolae TaxID=2874970 RepID=A0AAV1T6F9_9STRA
MQSSGRAGGDVDRALSSIRARADHLRHTVSRLEHNLAWNPASTWPELLSQYMVIAKQLENMNDEIPDLVQHFACVPRMSTPNSADIPLLLRTREDPEMEEAERQLLVGKARDINTEALQKMVAAHNDAVEGLEETFNDMSDGLLKAIRVNKYVVKSKPQSTQSQQFKYIESGSYE